MCPEQSTPQGDPPAAKLPPPDILRHVVDVHCHPTDSHISPEAMEELPIKICAMSTRPSDQELVRELANGNPDKVVPCFGQRLPAINAVDICSSCLYVLLVLFEMCYAVSSR